MDFFVLLWIGFTLLLLLVCVLLYRTFRRLSLELQELRFSKGSQSVKYGKLTEQWIPFSKDFPFSQEKFRFLGNPIDGLVFEENKIVFCEFKTASSQLNENQKKIRDLVQNKNVEWLEFKIR